MVGWVILFSVLGILLIVAITPIRLCFSFSEEAKLTIWIAFIPITILPKKTSDKPPKPTKKKKEKNQKKRGFSDSFREKGLVGFFTFLKKLLEIVLKLVGTIGKHLITERCEANLTIGAEDSAKAAEQYAKVCAVVYPIWGQLLSLTKCKRHHLKIAPDFLSANRQIACTVRIRLRVFWVLYAGTRAIKSFLLLILKDKKFQTKQEQNNQPAQS